MSPPTEMTCVRPLRAYGRSAERNGIVAIIAGISGEKGSQIFFQVFGVIYGLVAVLGFYYGDQPLLGIISNNSADSVLHVVIAIVALYLGFGMKPAATPTA